MSRDWKIDGWSEEDWNRICFAAQASEIALSRLDPFQGGSFSPERLTQLASDLGKCVLVLEVVRKRYL